MGSPSAARAGDHWLVAWIDQEFGTLLSAQLSDALELAPLGGNPLGSRGGLKTTQLACSTTTCLLASDGGVMRLGLDGKALDKALFGPMGVADVTWTGTKFLLVYRVDGSSTGEWRVNTIDESGALGTERVLATFPPADVNLRLAWGGTEASAIWSVRPIDGTLTTVHLRRIASDGTPTGAEVTRDTGEYKRLSVAIAHRTGGWVAATYGGSTSTEPIAVDLLDGTLSSTKTVSLVPTYSGNFEATGCQRDVALASIGAQTWVSWICADNLKSSSFAEFMRLDATGASLDSTPRPLTAGGPSLRLNGASLRLVPSGAGALALSRVIHAISDTGTVNGPITNVAPKTQSEPEIATNGSARFVTWTEDSKRMGAVFSSDDGLVDKTLTVGDLRHVAPYRSGFLVIDTSTGLARGVPVDAAGVVGESFAVQPSTGADAGAPPATPSRIRSSRVAGATWIAWVANDGPVSGGEGGPRSSASRAVRVADDGSVGPVITLPVPTSLPALMNDIACNGSTCLWVAPAACGTFGELGAGAAAGAPSCGGERVVATPVGFAIAEGSIVRLVDKSGVPSATFAGVPSGVFGSVAWSDHGWFAYSADGKAWVRPFDLGGFTADAVDLGAPNGSPVLAKTGDTWVAWSAYDPAFTRVHARRLAGGDSSDAGVTSDTGVDTASPEGATEDSGGCGCSLARRDAALSSFSMLTVAALVLHRRRRSI